MNRRAKDRQQRGWDEEEKLAAAQEAEAAEAAAVEAARPLRTTPAAGKRSYEVGEEDAGSRLDRFLALQAEVAAEALSRTRIQGLIEDGKVDVDGQPASDGNKKLRLGQTVSIEIPESRAAEPQAENIPLTVAYEDDELIVIDKPAGLVVHPASGHETGTLVNALIAHCGASLSGVGGVKRPGIVHRLDKDTSGLLVVAKTDAAHQGLSKLFADHGRTLPLEREYRALVWGAVERARGTVDAPVGRHGTHREKQAVVRGVRGREAVTHWELQETFPGKDGLPAASLLTCRLETGRTHQIRVHMAHIGHPVMGDPLYATGFRTKSARLADEARDALDALGRQALHAARLGFEHPLTGEWIEFESGLPDDMDKLLKALRG
ncbi:MAG: pseudouridine synthase [Hyphomicrobiales bacterium]|nr:pseudouridine synthase [Hyphomicrobiales bacterium]